MRMRFVLSFLVAAVLAVPAMAQLALPRVPLPTGQIGRTLDTVTGAVEPVLADAGRQLASLRVARIDRLVRTNSKALELTRDGYPARRGEMLIFGASSIAEAAISTVGFIKLGDETVDGLDLTVSRYRLPAGIKMRDVGPLIDRVAPGVEWSPDHVYEQAGRAPTVVEAKSASPITARVGVIDGAASASIGVTASKGFAIGAPVASNHGSAIVSLLKRAGVRTVAVADVYGTDPAGGSATAVARGLGWLVAGGAKVVTISLVGPENALLRRAVAAAQAKGTVIVAAVGNDGPAAPPAYPASYPGVVGVTGVDGRNRALIEAGRALNLDYAAPGADITGSDAKGRQVKLRGTSFAAPLAAARIAAGIGGDWRRSADAETVDLGKKGFDPVYGRGLLCGKCR